MESPDLLIAGNELGQRCLQRLSMSNRHGLVAGATGTGKTVSLQVLAEGFSAAGVPVFAVDVKGDLSGISAPGRPHEEIDRRVALLELTEYKAKPHPTLFWDLFGEHGHPVRTTISEMGPDILAALLDLNDTQTGILYACFAIADDEGLLLIDLKDLRSLLAFVGENAKALRGEYGNISAASVGAIQRRLLVLEEQGGDRFFGEPALQLRDLMQKDYSGIGVVSLLQADRLIRESPKLYAAFLLWLLSELFEELPEAGDVDKPKIVLFFDEAHLLFKGMPKGLLEKVEQVFRLIRSKAVGVYLVTQSPLDIPEAVLGQIGMKVQHALRAFTPGDQRAIRAVAAGFRNDHELDVQKQLTQLGLGEALVSTLDEQGAPSPVVAATMAPPTGQIGPIDEPTRQKAVAGSPMAGRYEAALDRESAYELLAERAKQAERRETEAEQETARQRTEEAAAKKSTRSSGRQSMGEAFMKSALRSVARSLGTRLVRGVLGSLSK